MNIHSPTPDAILARLREDMAALVKSIGGGEGLSEEAWADFREEVARLLSDANAERERLKR